MIVRCGYGWERFFSYKHTVRITTIIIQYPTSSPQCHTTAISSDSSDGIKNTYGQNGIKSLCEMTKTLNAKSTNRTKNANKKMLVLKQKKIFKDNYM